MKTINLTCLNCGCEAQGTATFTPACPVCGSGNLFDMARLEKIVKRVTAADSYADLCNMCQPAGTDRQVYAPSIYNRKHNGRRDKVREELTAALRASGYKVFDGVRCF